MIYNLPRIFIVNTSKKGIKIIQATNEQFIFPRFHTMVVVRKMIVKQFE